MTMLVGVSFKAKPGKAEELEALLSDPERGKAFAKALGASRNILLWQGDRMVRLLEVPDGATMTPMSDIAARNPEAREVLRKVGELAEPGFDVDDLSTMEAFNQQVGLRLVYDVRP